MNNSLKPDKSLDTIRNEVSQYYGQQLQSSADLLTSACCDSTLMPDWLKPVFSRIHPEVLARYYGCGLVAPQQLEACRILDLGCGSGRDVYALAQLAGAQGRVFGVDMTPEQLSIAQQHQSWHDEAFGYSNTEFHHGYIENLAELGFEPGSFDIIVSNCVVNLSTDKAAVLQGIKRLLKPGGEFYFSDVYADRRIPQALRDDPVLYGECLSGALYWNDFLSLAKANGFADPRLVTDRPLELSSQEIAKKTGNIQFFSATYRLFNLPELEPACEDYGQSVIYLGTIADHPDMFVLDSHHALETGRVFPVCGNTWRMLAQSRFHQHFQFIGDFKHHFGIFPDCGTAMPFATSTNPDLTTGGGACC